MSESMKVLIVEDDVDSLELLGLILNEHGFETVGCLSGREGLNKLEEIPGIGLILLDLMMPVFDGFQFLEAINEKDEIGSIPVIVVSALSDPDSISRAFDLGAFEYVTKPFDSLSLTARVKSALKFSRASRELRERNRNLVQLIKESNSQRKTLETNIEYLEDLIDIIDHKVKNAIVPIQSYSEVFKEEASNEKERSVFSNIYESIAALNLTVDDLLHGLRTWSVRSESNLSEVDLKALLENIDLFFQSGIKKKELDLEIEIDPSAPRHIRTDLTLLMEIIDNLVSNAIKYSGIGGSILLRIDRSGDQLRIVVKDSGIGIPKDDINRVFERNYIVKGIDVDEGINRTGIGLFLVSKFTESLGGTITVDSKLGEGTEFTVLLPIQEVDGS